MKRFADKHEKSARNMARESSDIDIASICKHMPHDIYTGEALQAYSEKQRRWKHSATVKWEEWDTDRNERRHDMLRRARADGDLGGTSTTASPRFKRRRSRSRSAEHAAASASSISVTRAIRGSSGDGAVAISSQSASMKRSKLATSMTTSSISSISRPNDPIRRIPSQSTINSHAASDAAEGERPRLRMQNEWNASLPKKAAKIYLVNTLDDEECPKVPKGFKYIEKSYIQ